MSEHTPGPWTLDASRMILGPCFTGELKAIVERVRGGNPREADANARLIASAPTLAADLAAAQKLNAELVECLAKIADFAPGNGDVCEIIARSARAVLAKVPSK